MAILTWLVSLQAKNLVAEDYERLLRDNEEIQMHIAKKNMEVEQGSIELLERQEELELLRREREELEMKAHLLEEAARAKENSKEDGEIDGCV